MKYTSSTEFYSDAKKSVLLLGMSGVGKSYVSEILSKEGSWKSYSIDERICQNLWYHILAIFPERMRPAAEFKMRRGNLEPLAKFLGKPGSVERGGLPFSEYVARQRLHFDAEQSALVEAPKAFDVIRAKYPMQPNFVCDTGGSICEVLDPVRDHLLLSAMSRRMLFVYIEAPLDYDQELVERFNAAPKPMYYRPKYLKDKWNEYLLENKVGEGSVDPDLFATWGFKNLLEHRRPLYSAIAKKWGCKISAAEIADVKSAQDFNELVASAIEQRNLIRDVKIGRNFRDRRRELKYDLASLAKHIGIDQRDLKKIESLRQMPSEKLEKRLYEILYIAPLNRKSKSIQSTK